MPRVRHYKTITTHRGNGVTNRTVRSRTWLGPYQSPQESHAMWGAIAGLFIAALVLAWPFAIKSIPITARWTIAIGWWLILLLLVAAGVAAKKKGQLKTNSDSTPVAPAAKTSPIPAAKAASNPPVPVVPAGTLQKAKEMLDTQRELMEKQTALIEAQSRHIEALKQQRSPPKPQS